MSDISLFLKEEEYARVERMELSLHDWRNACAENLRKATTLDEIATVCLTNTRLFNTMLLKQEQAKEPA